MESQIFATALNINKTIMRHTVIYQRSKIIEDHESSMRKKQKRGVPIYLAADVSVESINIRREWDGISKALKREKKNLANKEYCIQARTFGEAIMSLPGTPSFHVGVIGLILHS